MAAVANDVTRLRQAGPLGPQTASSDEDPEEDAEVQGYQMSFSDENLIEAPHSRGKPP
jgi:hypothetical protein